MLLFLLFSLVQAKITVPGEWQSKQNGTWVAWPVYTFYGDSRPQFVDMISYISQSELVYILYNSEGERRSAMDYISNWNLQNNNRVNVNNLVWTQIQHTDFWLRDYLLFGKGDLGTLEVVSFSFNEWGYASVSNAFRRSNLKDSKIAERIAEFLGVPVVFSNVTMEAGGLEFNSDPKYGNRLILSEAVFLQRQRMQFDGVFSTKREIHNALIELFNLDDIIWLPQFRYDRNARQEYAVPQCDVADTDPLSPCNIPSSDYYSIPSGGGLVADESAFNGPQLNPDDDSSYVLCPITTNGHTDEFVKWYGPNHVLLSYVPGTYASHTMEGRTQYRLNVIKDILVSKGIKVKFVPTAPEAVLTVDKTSGTYIGFLDMTYVTSGPYWGLSDLTGKLLLSIYPKGSTTAQVVSARSYMNAVVTNSHVLVPAYNDPRDNEAYQAFYDAFQAPGNPSGMVRKVVQIKDLDSVNGGGGGMHCITQNQPN